MTRCFTLGIALGVMGCASTAMNSMPATEVQGRVFHNILVVAAFEDIGILRATEDRFAAASVSMNITFVPSYQVFFPGRQYTAEESAGLLRQHRIEGVLVVSVRQTGENTYYVPPTYVSGCTAWNPVYGCSQVTTTATGGGSYQKPWARFRAQLYDATTGVPVWVATAATGGNALATSLTLVQSMADETMVHLAADGVIAFCLQERELDVAKSRLREDSDSLAAARVIRGGSTVRYVIPEGVSPERRHRMEELNDSVSRAQRSADSLVSFFEGRVEADGARLRVAKQVVSGACLPRRK